MNRYFYVPVYFLLFSLILFSPYANSSDSCECDFDTDKYSAKCSCSLVCAVTVKNGRKCKITCDGESTTKEGDRNLYGSLTDFKESIRNLMTELFHDGKKLYMAKPDYAKYIFPMLMRTSYISADFLTESQVIKLDQIITHIFYSEWNSISSGLYSESWREFSIRNIPNYRFSAKLRIKKFRLSINLDEIEHDNIFLKVILFPKEQKE